MSATQETPTFPPAAVSPSGQFGGREALPPGPWTWTDNGPIDRPLGTGFVYLHDATGRRIGTVWGTPAEKVAIANLICEARDQFDTAPQEDAVQ
jgi:hypothetical protein